MPFQKMSTNEVLGDTAAHFLNQETRCALVATLRAYKNI